MKYYDNRKQDSFVEHACAKFLDKYFWTKLGKRHERILDDTTKNICGIDLELGSLKIDEKVKNKERNKIGFTAYNEAPSVEILNTNAATHEYNVPGWFVHPNSLTNAYAFINVTDYSGNTEETLELKKMRVFLFFKKHLQKFIGREDLFDEAEDLKLNGTKNKNDKITRPIKIHSPRGETLTLYLAYSYYLPEKPVNLVTPVDTVLKKLPTWCEWEITPEKFKLIGAQSDYVPKIIMP